MYTGAEYVQEGLQMEQAAVLYNICEWRMNSGRVKFQDGILGLGL